MTIINYKFFLYFIYLFLINNYNSNLIYNKECISNIAKLQKEENLSPDKINLELKLKIIENYFFLQISPYDIQSTPEFKYSQNCYLDIYNILNCKKLLNKEEYKPFFNLLLKYKEHHTLINILINIIDENFEFVKKIYLEYHEKIFENIMFTPEENSFHIDLYKDFLKGMIKKVNKFKQIDKPNILTFFEDEYVKYKKLTYSEYDTIKAYKFNKEITALLNNNLYNNKKHTIISFIFITALIFTSSSKFNIPIYYKHKIYISLSISALYSLLIYQVNKRKPESQTILFLNKEYENLLKRGKH
jgi:hypothetical protein